MSRIRLFALFILTTIFTNAQEIPVQFALTDTAGIELPNRSIAVRTSFTSDTLAIAPEYQETQSTITNQFGIASYWIGSGITTLSSTYDNISKDWINPGSLYYIVVEVDSTGSGYQDLATIQYRFPIIAIKSSKSDTASFADTSGYALTIDPRAFNDSSAVNEIQSLEQVLSVDSNASGKTIYNLNSLTIGDTIRPSAALAINSTDAGLLLPRLTKIQRNAIVNPEKGLIVYCTDCVNEGRVSVYDGNTWELLSQTNSTGSYAVISAGPVQNITVSGATFNGSISDSGGTTVFAKGFCLSSQPYPSLADVVIAPTLLDSSGVFKGRADYLERNSKYYVRAYATNAAGTVYGPQQEFLSEGLLAIGDTFGGGIVGYILHPGDNGYDPDEQHGIIMAHQDYGTSLTWGSCNDIVPSNSESPGSYIAGRTSEFIYDAYYNDSIWNSLCHDSLAAYPSYSPSIMHIVRDITWGGYSDWTVGTIGDYMAIFTNITTLDTLLNQVFMGEYWTSSGCRQTSNYFGWTTTRYRFRFKSFTNGTTNPLTGVITTNRAGNSERANNETDFLIRPIRYF